MDDEKVLSLIRKSGYGDIHITKHALEQLKERKIPEIVAISNLLEMRKIKSIRESWGGRHEVAIRHTPNHDIILIIAIDGETINIVTAYKEKAK